MLILQIVCFLTHCGLVTSYGNIDLGLDWLRLWHATWLHQAINWNNYDGSSTGCSGIHSRVMFTWVSAPNYVWNVHIWNYTTSHREESAYPMKLVKTSNDYYPQSIMQQLHAVLRFHWGWKQQTVQGIHWKTALNASKLPHVITVYYV